MSDTETCGYNSDVGSKISMISREDFTIQQASISELIIMRDEALEDEIAYTVHCQLFTAEIVHNSKQCECARESKRVATLCSKILAELSLRK